MKRFDEILSYLNPTDYVFNNQTAVEVRTGYNIYRLTKLDVINSINKYLNDIHCLSDKPIRSENMNFNSFKMYDLVPYLYTLINLYLTLKSNIVGYRRFLLQLKLTRFCHLPFESEIIVSVDSSELVVECAYLRSSGSDSYGYVSLLSHFHCLCYQSLDELRDKLQSLYPFHRVILKVVGC